MFDLGDEPAQPGDKLARLGDQRIDIGERLLAKVLHPGLRIMERHLDVAVGVGNSLDQLVEVAERGYTMGDDLLRPAKVLVAKAAG